MKCFQPGNQKLLLNIFLTVSLVILIPNLAQAQTLRVEVENKSVSIDAENFHTKFNCEYDSRYEIPISNDYILPNHSMVVSEIKDSLVASTTAAAKSLGGCEAKLQLCQQVSESNNFKNEHVTQVNEQLKLCNQQQQFFSYERIAFIIAFLIVVVAVLKVNSARGKNANH